MSTITPTIGRKVYFYTPDPAIGGAMDRYDDKQPFDATVIYVWGPVCVSLRVTDHAGNTHVRTSVPLRDPDVTDAHGREYFATWMPYQVGQAKAQAIGAAGPVTTGAAAGGSPGGPVGASVSGG